MPTDTYVQLLWKFVFFLLSSIGTYSYGTPSMEASFQVSYSTTPSLLLPNPYDVLLGFKSYISRYPFDGVGISVLTNDNELGTAISIAIKYRLSDQALGLTPIASKAM